jgi:hypothetical protein
MRVKVERAEGPIELVGKFEFDSFEAATKYFADNVLSFPKVGYDKHDVEITFDNDDVLLIRIDAVSRNSEYFTLNRHDVKREARGYLKFLVERADYVDDETREDAVEMLMKHFGGLS